MDTQRGIIAIIAAGALALLLLLSVVGIIILAVSHDGQMAEQAFQTFTQVLIIAIPAAATLAGVDRVVQGITASKTISSATAVQVAAVNNGATPAAAVAATSSLPAVPAMVAEPTSSPSGVTAPASVPETVPETPAADPASGEGA